MAAVAVWNTTELCVQILGLLPAKQLLQVSAVDKRTYAIIHRSPEALHGLLFAGISDTSPVSGLPKLNPLLLDHYLHACFSCMHKQAWGGVWTAELALHGSSTSVRALLGQLRKAGAPVLPIWHVKLKELRELSNMSLRSSWEELWLRADKGLVEIHVIVEFDPFERRFRCLYARTLREVVAWALFQCTWAYDVKPEVSKWRLQMFEAPEEMLEELGWKDVVPFDGKDSLTMLK